MAIVGVLARGSIVLLSACASPTDGDSLEDTACVPSEEVPYDGIDQDCDGIDLDDLDGDGHGPETDCDDGDPDVYLGAPETPYDGVDQDCDGEDLDDLDNDGFPLEADCNDSDDSVHPAASEVCNDVDDDCDGETDEGAVDAVAAYVDTDGDGFGSGDLLQVCLSDGYSTVDGDCDDGAAAIFPGADEVCDGVDNNCDGYLDAFVVGVTHSSIQQAVDAACADGDIVYVGEGTWKENVLLSRPLHLMGLDAGPDGIIIDGGGCTRGTDKCNTIEIGPTATGAALSKLTIANGAATNGGGVYSEASLSMADCRVENNVAQYGGGVVSVDSVTVDACIFEGNTASYAGGAVWIPHGSQGAVFEASTFEANSAPYGGAVYLDEASTATTSLHSNKFIDNGAYLGGALMWEELVSVSVEGNDFTDNYCTNTSQEDGCGGAVFCVRRAASDGYSYSYSDNTFSGNTPQDTSPLTGCNE